jgi:hypothetical protein
MKEEVVVSVARVHGGGAFWNGCRRLRSKRLATMTTAVFAFRGLSFERA